MLLIFFLNNGVTWVCLNELGKVPRERDVLKMFVSAGSSVGEMA